MIPLRNDLEWLEADGLGGFASGPVAGPRTRRYHALLLAATQPPAGRVVLVNGCEVTVRGAAGTFALSSQRYAPDVVHPDGIRRLATFEDAPWPRWTYALEDGTRIVHELFVPQGCSVVVQSWRVEANPSAGPRASGQSGGGMGALALEVRPLLSGRDFHALQRENAACNLEADTKAGAGRVRMTPYSNVPPVIAAFNGAFEGEPTWYRNFQYDEERARGLDAIEDLSSPGAFRFDLARGPAVLIFGAGDAALPAGRGAIALQRNYASRETRRRAAFATRLERAADAYVVARGKGRTIIAGYPWFGDWGRDTFIALRGLCLETGRLAEARAILLEWAGAVSEGMLPNRFPDHGETAEYNSVDASLWYVVVAHEYLEACARAGRAVSGHERRKLERAVDAILDGYAHGTRYGIHAEGDGLLAAGEPGVQLTWMDARVDERVITPRIGKPVEIQALWLNALALAGRRELRWRALFERGRGSFEARFWNAERGCLYDVVDADGMLGRADASLRPNQIFAVGGLPIALLDGERARSVVDEVERVLLTPRGLRSLAPDEPGYAPHYRGGPGERDAIYHQGTVWPWLQGAFVEAWLRTRRDDERPTALGEARRRFLEPLLAALDRAGVHHLCEIEDAEPPHAPRGCPFQAWSVGETIRIARLVERAAAAPAPADSAVA